MDNCSAEGTLMGVKSGWWLGTTLSAYQAVTPINIVDAVVRRAANRKYRSAIGALEWPKTLKDNLLNRRLIRRNFSSLTHRQEC